MVILPADADDEAILALVRQWVNLVAGDRIEAAQDLLNSEAVERDWPPNLIRELLAGYEPITPVETAQITDLIPNHSVDRLESADNPAIAGVIEFDLPINGAWSDLTASFWIKKCPDGLILELFDIHIL